MKASSRAGRGGRGAAGSHRTDREREKGSGWLEAGPSIWAAAALYAAITIVLFREFVFSSDMLFGQDTVGLGYMARDFFARAITEGQGFPLWNPIILGGTPFLESFAGGDVFYPSALLLLIMDTHRALGWKLVIHVFLAGLFMYGWVRSLGCSRWGSTIAGAAYLLGPFMVTLVYPGHDGKLFVTALTPLLFWMTDRALQGGRIRDFTLLGIVVALVIFTPHLQMAYFLFGAVGVFAAFRVWELGWRGSAVPPRRSLTRGGLFLAAAVVGAGAAGVQLLPAVTYITEHSRRTVTTVEASPEAARAYSSSWSLHPEEIASLVVPEFVGNNAGGAGWTTGTYWGRNVFKLNHEYVGLTVVLLALLALLGRRAGRLGWCLAGIGAASLFFALGAHTPVWRLAFELLPGIRLFRAPSMTIFLFGFAAVTLAAFGADRLVSTPEAAGRGGRGGERGSRLLWGAAGLLAFGFILSASGILFELWTGLFQAGRDGAQALALDRAEPFITRGFLVAALISAALGGVRWIRVRGWLAPGGAALLVLTLVVVDLFRVNAPFIQIEEFQAFARPDANVEYLIEQRRQSPQPFRVFSLFGGGEDVAPGMHGLELAGGHHPNDLARYRELVGAEGGSFPEHLLNPNVLGILNVRYLLWPDAQIGPAEGLRPVSRITFPGGETYASVYEIPTLPRARLVTDAVVIPDEEAVAFILSEDFDPSTQVVLSSAPPTPLSSSPAEGRVVWVERGNNRLVLDVESDGPALLVVGDNWYPAWEAKVNGEPVPLLRANHALRALPVPAGASTVEMVFRSTPVRAGLYLSGAALLLLILGLLTPLAGAFSLRRDRPAGRERPAG